MSLKYSAAPSSVSPALRMLTQQHMSNHYRRVNQAKASVDTSMPVTMLIQKRRHSRSSLDSKSRLSSRASSQSSSGVSNRSNSYSSLSMDSTCKGKTPSPYVSHSSLLTNDSQHHKDMTSSNTINSLYRDLIDQIVYDTKKSPSTYTSRSGSPSGDQWRSKRIIDRKIGGDFLETNPERFTNPKQPHTPKILADNNASSKLIGYRYYNSPRRRQNLTTKSDRSSLISTPNNPSRSEMAENYLSSHRSNHYRDSHHSSEEEVLLHSQKIHSFNSQHKPISKKLVKTLPSRSHNTSAPRDSLERAKVKKQLEIEDQEMNYLQFVTDITNEILARGIFTNKIINQVFEKHVENRKQDLEMDMMYQMLKKLKLSLGIPEEDIQDENSVGISSNTPSFHWQSETKQLWPNKVEDTARNFNVKAEDSQISIQQQIKRKQQEIEDLMSYIVQKDEQNIISHRTKDYDLEELLSDIGLTEEDLLYSESTSNLIGNTYFRDFHQQLSLNGDDSSSTMTLKRMSDDTLSNRTLGRSSIDGDEHSSSDNKVTNYKKERILSIEEYEKNQSLRTKSLKRDRKVHGLKKEYHSLANNQIQTDVNSLGKDFRAAGRIDSMGKTMNKKNLMSALSKARKSSQQTEKSHPLKPESKIPTVINSPQISEKSIKVKRHPTSRSSRSIAQTLVLDLKNGNDAVSNFSEDNVTQHSSKTSLMSHNTESFETLPNKIIHMKLSKQESKNEYIDDFEPLNSDDDDEHLENTKHLDSTDEEAEVSLIKNIRKNSLLQERTQHRKYKDVSEDEGSIPEEADDENDS